MKHPVRMEAPHTFQKELWEEESWKAWVGGMNGRKEAERQGSRQLARAQDTPKKVSGTNLGRTGWALTG